MATLLPCSHITLIASLALENLEQGLNDYMLIRRVNRITWCLSIPVFATILMHKVIIQYSRAS